MSTKQDAKGSGVVAIAALTVVVGVLLMHGISSHDDAGMSMIATSQPGHAFQMRPHGEGTRVDRAFVNTSHTFDLATCIWVLVSGLGAILTVRGHRMLRGADRLPQRAITAPRTAQRAPPLAARLSLVGVLQH